MVTAIQVQATEVAWTCINRSGAKGTRTPDPHKEVHKTHRPGAVSTFGIDPSDRSLRWQRRRAHQHAAIRAITSSHNRIQRPSEKLPPGPYRTGPGANQPEATATTNTRPSMTCRQTSSRPVNHTAAGRLRPRRRTTPQQTADQGKATRPAMRIRLHEHRPPPIDT